VKERFAAIFWTRTREEWVELLQTLETCFSPVLTLDEALGHEHSVARSSFVPVDGVLQAHRGGLRDWGFTSAEITDLETEQAIAQLPMASAHQT
jgi:alpha-methylacyl-CoA racemase